MGISYLTRGFTGLAVAALAFGLRMALAQSEVPAVTGDARVDKLLSQMTLAEKLTLIHDGREDPRDYQGQAGYVAGVPRLGIPGLRLADGPPGVLARHPSQAETATMGVAATFDLQLARQNGEVIGREARALGIDVSLQPFINLDRDLALRRSYNTFGEDPLLTSRMGAATIEGIQSQHVMAVAKHFIGYETTATDVWIDEQSLHEVYLPPFEAAVKAGVASVMCSYNHVNGPHACGNRALLTGILRDELGFKGFVVSDWGATHSAQFMNAGLDMEMIDGPDSTGYQEPAFLGAQAAALPPPADPSGEDMGDIYGGNIPEEPAVPPMSSVDLGAKVKPETIAEGLADGAISEAAVTRAAGRVLYEMERFGFLDGGSKHDVTAQAVEANASIIERAGEEAAVLLKNDGRALPLKQADLDSVVLIGPTAGQVDAIGINGERSMGLTARQVGPLQALRTISGNANIQYAVNDDMTGSPVPAGALSHDGKPGLAYAGPDGAHVDTAVNFTVKGGNALAPNLKAGWNGTLTVAKSRHVLALSAGLGHRRQPLYRRQAGGRDRHIPGRCAWRHSASQPGQCDPHDGRAGQCPPRGRAGRGPSRRPKSKSVPTPPGRRCRSGSTGTRRNNAKRITRRPSMPPGAPRSRWSLSGRGARPSSSFPASRALWWRKCPRSTRIPSWC